MEQFQIKILIKQNLSLVTLLQSKQQEMEAMRGRISRLEAWGRVVCSYFTGITEEYMTKGIKSELLMDLLGKAYELGQFQQTIKDQKLKIIYNHMKSKESSVAFQESMIEQQEEQKIESHQKPFRPNFCLVNHLQQNLTVKIAQLTSENQVLKRRLTLLERYDQNAINKLIEENAHLCFCGGQQINLSSRHQAQLQVLRKRLNLLQAQKGTTIQIQPAESEVIPKVNNQEQQYMLDRIVTLEKKVMECKLNHKVNLDMVLKSQPYHILKGQAKQMITYISYLMGKLKSVVQYLKIMEKERTNEIEELITYQKNKKNQFKRQSLIEGSEVFQLLGEVKTQLNQYSEQSKKAMNRIKAQMQSNQTDKQTIDKLHQKIQNLEAGRNRFSFFGPNHKKISFILHRIPAIIYSEQCRDYFIAEQIDYKQLGMDWNIFVNEYKQAANRWDSLEMTGKYRQEALSYSKSLPQITEEAKRLFVATEEKSAIIEKMVKQIDYKITEIEFSFGEYKANEYFKAKEQAKLRKTYEERIGKMSSAEEQIKSIMEDRARILELVEVQTLQHKQTVSGLLTDIQNLKQQTATLSKENAETSEMIAKWAEEKTRLKLQIQHMKTLITPEAVQGAKIQQLKLQLQILRRKITCVCNRGHEATCVLNCKHIFCKTCVQSIVRSRKRCCPVCSTKFSQHSEVHSFHYN